MRLENGKYTFERMPEKQGLWLAVIKEYDAYRDSAEMWDDIFGRVGRVEDLRLGQGQTVEGGVLYADVDRLELESRNDLHQQIEIHQLSDLELLMARPEYDKARAFVGELNGDISRELAGMSSRGQYTFFRWNHHEGGRRTFTTPR